MTLGCGIDCDLEDTFLFFLKKMSVSSTVVCGVPLLTYCYVISYTVCIFVGAGPVKGG